MLLMAGLMAANGAIKSPDGSLRLKVNDASLVLTSHGKPVVTLPEMGIGDAKMGQRQKFSFTRTVTASYDMLSGKRSHCHNEAREYQAQLSPTVRLVVRLYNDGLAFRYELTGLNNAPMPTEHTTYLIGEGTRRWMQQWADSYEGFFPLSTTARQKPVPSYGPPNVSADGWNCRWGYPALLEPADGLFALITESNIERRQSASCLRNDRSLEHFRVCPDDNKVALTGSWHTPWRVVIVGTLSQIVESTLVTDVAEPSTYGDTSWIKPGVVSWIYWAYNHGSNDYGIISQYVDLAATLHLPYMLIDAEWDTMKDGKTIDDALAYARSRGVRPLIWYNSSVGWVDGAPTPKYRLNKPEDREREFAWCERMGVAGVKIDFFSGDNQMNMDYCLDLLESAARHHLLVNFHGATVPRGWQRTYPNLLSTEGVYGAEWYNNVPTFTQKAAAHNATLPFTRNVIGPMDYTPCAFSDSQHPHITTHGHELALTVLFESGLQHLADRPESLLAQPREVGDFLSQLPAAWDDTRLLDGYPGTYVVMARRSGTTWYVAGINGTDDELTVSHLQLPSAQPSSSITLFCDGAPWQITHPVTLPTELRLAPRGGFVAKISAP
ncbi:MAG: glycoside hydrolase family 97 protein [Prevotella sp.]|nr:glycoside hydrolase family 97 protein [Prevotella sp.]